MGIKRKEKQYEVGLAEETKKKNRATSKNENTG